MHDPYVIRILIAGTILFVVFAFFLIFFIVFMRAKRNTYYMERQQLLFDNAHGKAEEAERVFNETSKRIHDDIIQASFLIRLNLKHLQKSTEEKKMSEMLCSTLKLTDALFDEGNKICFLLNNDFLKSNNICQIISSGLYQVCNPRGIAYDLEANDEYRLLDADAKIIIFRIAMEAIQNAAQHGAATQIDVLLDLNGNTLCMQIKDNGQGFPSEKLHANPTVGLSYMYQRAERIKGELKIESSPGEGCKVSLICPC